MTEQAQPLALAPAPQAPDPRRRGFLKVLPLGALAVAAGGARADDSAAAAAPAPDAQPAGGYRETEHIRRYYRTAAYW